VSAATHTRVDAADERPPLVLLNALGTSAELWAAQVAALAGRTRVVTCEHPALGSVPALAAALLARLDSGGIERASLCGLSLGAMVAMQLAADSPERVDRLVLACTAARFGRPEDWALKAELVRAHGMQAVARDALDAWFTPAYVERGPFLEMQLRTPAADYALGLEAIGSFDFRRRLPEISAPTLVIAGAADPATTPLDARLIASRVPGAKLLVIDRAAHLANVERPAEFTAALVAHLGL
jgi:3-oxoadipate enol-lactonase